MKRTLLALVLASTLNVNAADGSTSATQFAPLGKEFNRGAILKVSWDLPHLRENGDHLPPEEISHFVLRWICDTGIEGTLEVKSPIVKTDLPTRQIWGKCNFIIASVDTDGLYSDWSDPRTVLIKLEGPKAGGFR